MTKTHWTITKSDQGNWKIASDTNGMIAMALLEADAKLICAAPKLLRMAYRYRSTLINEYEALQESSSLSDGSIPNPDDREELKDIQCDIDAIDDVLKSHGLTL